jgi:hypothetical protein
MRQLYPYPCQDPFFVSLMLSIACKPGMLAFSSSFIPETLLIYPDLTNNKILITTSAASLSAGRESIFLQQFETGSPEQW